MTHTLGARFRLSSLVYTGSGLKFLAAHVTNTQEAKADFQDPECIVHEGDGIFLCRDGQVSEHARMYFGDCEI